MPSSHLILCRPLLLLPSIFPSIRVFSSHQVAKVLAFQFQHQSFQWTPRTNSFRMDWLNLLEVQGMLKSLLQHYSSKASILWYSAFFIVQLSHPYMTTDLSVSWRSAEPGWTPDLSCRIGSSLLNMFFFLRSKFQRQNRQSSCPDTSHTSVHLTSIQHQVTINNGNSHDQESRSGAGRYGLPWRRGPWLFAE